MGGGSEDPNSHVFIVFIVCAALSFCSMKQLLLMPSGRKESIRPQLACLPASHSSKSGRKWVLGAFTCQRIERQGPPLPPLRVMTEADFYHAPGRARPPHCP